MTIKEAFERYGNLKIDYRNIVYCERCDEEYGCIDEENSFCGEIEWFKDKFMRPENGFFGVMSLYDCITVHDTYFTDRFEEKYRECVLEVDHDWFGYCPACEEKINNGEWD